MLCDKRAAKIAVELVQPQDFYTPAHQTLFGLFAELVKDNPDLDEIHVEGEIERRGLAGRVGGTRIVGRLIEEVPTAANVERYIRILKDRAAERKAVQIAGEIIRQAHGGAGQTIAETVRSRVETLKHNAVLTEAGTLDGVFQQVEDEIEGRRFNIEFNNCFYLNKKLLFMPGTVTVLCGSPGASKSFFVLEAVWRWYFQGISCSCLMIEKGADYHRRRAVAQMAGKADLQNYQWCKQHPDEARDLMAQYQPTLDKFHEARLIQAPMVGQRLTREFLMRWLEAEVAAGRLIVVIDPISKLMGGSERNFEQEEMIDSMQQIARASGLRILMVTHPRAGKPGQAVTPHLDNMQGSKAFERFTDGALWLQYHKQDNATVSIPTGRADVKFNRTMHCLKVRDAAGTGDRIAFYQEPWTLCHAEQGELVSMKEKIGKEK